MPPLNLPQLGIGDRVQHPLLVVDCHEKAKRDGEPFLIFTLGNATGQMDTEPIWSNQLAAGWADGVERGSIVQVIGNVARYDGSGGARRQIRVMQPLRPLPPGSVPIEELLPHVPPQRIAQLWHGIDTVRQKMTSVTLRRVLDLFFGDEAFRLRFERTPGSIRRHHAKVGGLLLHVYEVTRFARTAAEAQRAHLDLVTVGALLHDVGKVEAYEIAPEGFRYTACGRLLGHVVLGCMMLERRVAGDARQSAGGGLPAAGGWMAARGEPVCTEGQLLELQHLILSHHGRLEFGSPVEPMTLEAEIVHWADEASAKIGDFSEALSDPDGFLDDGEFSRRQWRVDNRRLWRRPHGWE